MKILMLVFSLLFLSGCSGQVSCEGCLGCWGLYEELNCETVLRLRTDYRNQLLDKIGWASADELPLDDIRVLSYHGIFSGHMVLSMRNSLPHTPVIIFVEIAGYTFQFTGDESGLYVYDAPRFITISTAYENGLISNQDVSKIWQLVNPEG